MKNNFRRVTLLVVVCAMSAAVRSQDAVNKVPEANRAKASVAPHLTFDVASIRESGDGRWSTIENSPTSSLYQAERITVLGLIIYAYDIKVGGQVERAPNWTINEKYSIMAKSDAVADEMLAKLPRSESLAEKRHMLQALLADRFGLRIHSETRISTIYVLVTTPKTAKLLTSVQGNFLDTMGTCSVRYSSEGQEIASKGCSFQELLMYAREEMGTEVVDRTGLSGLYAFHLTWSWPSLQAGERYPLFADALRDQLGLSLQKAKAPVTFWIVDSVERPSPN